ncbi:MAG: hypothetical protein Tsb0020_50390 [Haliangiales bacterium]
MTRKASSSVAAAEAAEAEVYAPYHYHLAVSYLRKAREEAAAADYQAANRFGERSYEAAERARELAIERAANPSDVLWRPPPGTPGYDGTAPAAADAAADGAPSDDSGVEISGDGEDDGDAGDMNGGDGDAGDMSDDAGDMSDDGDDMSDDDGDTSDGGDGDAGDDAAGDVPDPSGDARAELDTSHLASPAPGVRS